MVFFAVFFDRKSDVFRAQLLASGERSARTAAQLANDVAQMFLNDRLTEIFVGEIVIEEKIIIEEMAERAVADIVQQPGDAHVFLDERRRRTLVAQNFAQRRIEMLGEFSGEVHGAEGMLKTAVLGGRIDPARALQLINIA